MERQEKWSRTLVLVSMAMSGALDIYVLGHTATMLAGLYQEKVDLQFTDDDISWISSITMSAIVFGGMAATVVAEKIGRRYSMTLFKLPEIVYFIILYYARDLNVFLAIRFLVGVGFGASLPVNFLATAEYSAPAVRGTNLCIVTLSGSVGAALGHILGLVFHWRTAGLIAVVPATLSCLLPLFCVESPSWYASKGMIEECRTAFRTLHGCKAESEKELQLLIEVEKAKYNRDDDKTHTVMLVMRRLKVAVTKKYFWELILLTSVINVYKLICGKVLYVMFGVTMLQNITGHSDVLVYSFIIDVLMVVGCAISCYLMDKFKRKTILVVTGLLNNIFLIVLSITLYFKPENDLGVFSWINTAIFGCHIFIVHVGLFPLLEMVWSELYPLEIKLICSLIISLLSTVFLTMYMKVIPTLFVVIDYYGVFLMTVASMFCFLLYLLCKMPETKGKTLQEIELHFKKDIILNSDELKNTLETNDLF